MTYRIDGAAHLASSDNWQKIIAQQPSADGVKDVPKKKLDKWHYIGE